MHRDAAETLRGLEGQSLVTHNYVLVEAAAIAHRRLGGAAARDLLEDLVPISTVIWVEEGTHQAAVSAFLAAVRRRPSLVDWVTFEVMRRHVIGTAFAFDRDFVNQGFQTIP